MKYTTDNLHHMISDEPREFWVDIVKPLVINEDISTITLSDNCIYGFTLESLSPNYRCKFNINDIVYFEGDQWLIVSLPLLDSRNPIDSIKQRSISVMDSGIYFEILRPNYDGIDGKLYIDNEFKCNLSYNDSVTENEVSLVPDDEISKEMIKFRKWMLNPKHRRVDLLW